MIFKEIDNIRDVGVICHYFVFSDYDRLWFGNFLDDLRFKSKRKVEL